MTRQKVKPFRKQQFCLTLTELTLTEAQDLRVQVAFISTRNKCNNKGHSTTVSRKGKIDASSNKVDASPISQVKKLCKCSSAKQWLTKFPGILLGFSPLGYCQGLLSKLFFPLIYTLKPKIKENKTTFLALENLYFFS